MTEQSGAYARLDRYEARKRVVEDLAAQGLLDKTVPHSHNVGHCQRCDTVIEPLVSKQWFVKVKPLAEPAIRAVEEGRTSFTPDNYAKVYFEWMNNIHDWCISRQLWWGHRIPAWHCDKCGEMMVLREEPQGCRKCGNQELRRESDVLDTWFSSALWPFSTMGWPDKTPELQAYYPTSVLVTGFDIIFFWVARMMMMGLRFMDEVPFRTVYINGLVRDERGQKMSKSRGNIIDPLQIIDEYGTDAVRFTLSVMAVPGTDIPFSISRMAGYRAFCNKIWNAGRFLLLNLEREKTVGEAEITRLWDAGELEIEHRWILTRLEQVTSGTVDNLDKFRFHEASNELYHFFWHEFCDWYIEFIKEALTGGAGPAAKDRAEMVAVYCFESALRLLHPFVPFITEELWQRFPHEGETIMLRPYPKPARRLDEASLQAMEQLQDLITAVRTVRASNNLNPREKVSLQMACRPEACQLVTQEKHKLEYLAHLKDIQFVETLGIAGSKLHGVSTSGEFALLVEQVVDVAGERQRLEKQILKLQQDLIKLTAKLKNEDFLSKAPAEVVDSIRGRHQASNEQLRLLQEKFDGLS